MSPEILLKFPTNRTVEGPNLRQHRGELVVEYDFENDDGSVEWSKVVFTEVLAVEYRQDPCCTPDSVIGAREIRSSGASDWLADVLARWEKSVGRQEWQQKQGGSSRFRHFTIYFDDAGCVNVIAASCYGGE